jgi:hypothetical protein
VGPHFFGGLVLGPGVGDPADLAKLPGSGPVTARLSFVDGLVLGPGVGDPAVRPRLMCFFGGIFRLSAGKCK